MHQCNIWTHRFMGMLCCHSCLAPTFGMDADRDIFTFAVAEIGAMFFVSNDFIRNRHQQPVHQPVHIRVHQSVHQEGCQPVHHPAHQPAHPQSSAKSDAPIPRKPTQDRYQDRSFKTGQSRLCPLMLHSGLVVCNSTTECVEQRIGRVHGV